jgi:hypothetical protein
VLATLVKGWTSPRAFVQAHKAQWRTHAPAKRRSRPPFPDAEAVASASQTAIRIMGIRLSVIRRHYQSVRIQRADSWDAMPRLSLA